MAEQEEPFRLKNIYSRRFIQETADLMQAVRADFPKKHFIQDVFSEEWESLELKQRMRHIGDCLRIHLPPNYKNAAEYVALAAERLIQERGEQLNFEYIFLAGFVERFGTQDPDFSIPLLERITRFTSAEFAVRPFLLQYPERMYPQMLEWSRHSNPFVRRLSSEGFRPRLPWGMGIPALKRNPSPILPVLENLKNDPAETVRRSVANNLNDISKDHPDLVLQTGRSWQGQSAETDWIVRHACRSLLKKGHETALNLFGFEKKDNRLVVDDFYCTPQLAIGERLEFGFVVSNPDAEPFNLRLEYVIDYLNASGKSSRKVFKIKELSLNGKETLRVDKYQRFQDFTTRKHYPGTHRIAVSANGVELAEKFFEVTVK